MVAILLELVPKTDPGKTAVFCYCWLLPPGVMSVKRNHQPKYREPRPMTHRNAPFHDALVQYTALGFDLLKKHVSPSDLSTMSSQWHKWVPMEGSNGHFYEAVGRATYPEIILNDLHVSREFFMCMHVLLDNPITARCVDEFIGIAPPDRAYEPASQLRVAPKMGAESYCDHIWRRLAPVKGVFDAVAFEEEYKRLEDDFYSDDIAVRIMVPLDIQANNPIDMGDGIAMKGLDEGDIEKYLDVQRPQRGPVLGATFERPPRWSLVHETRVSKMIGRSGANTRASYLDAIDDVITALCVFRRGFFRAKGYFVVSDSISHQGTLRIGGGETYWSHHDPLNFDDAAAEEFVEFFQSLRGVMNGGNRKVIGVAPRRVRYAAQRHRPEDRLIDLLIAAEALFLPQQSSEIGYKFAMRAAYLLEDTPARRRTVFAEMKKAYGIRSKLVHGGSPDYPSVDGQKMRPEKYALYIEDAVLDSLHRIIERVNDGRGWGRDEHWDALILGSGDSVQ